MALLKWFRNFKEYIRKKLFDRNKLPEEFDVFFLEPFESEADHLVFPGNVYASDTFVVNHLTISGNFFADEYVECNELTVYGKLISQNYIDCHSALIGDLLDCYDIASLEDFIIATDYECQRCKEEI